MTKIEFRRNKYGGLFKLIDGKPVKVKDDTLEHIKKIVGRNYEKNIIASSDLRYENGKLIRNTKIGEREEPDKPVRNANEYKIFARHFETALPFTHYYIANTLTGQVFEIPEIITGWNYGALNEIVENIKRGGDAPTKYDNEDIS